MRHDGLRPAGSPLLWPVREGHGVVRMRLGAEVADDRADARVIALTRTASARVEHVERLLDVGSTPAGDLALTLEATPRSLGELLGAPGDPTLGEVVTIVAPLMDAAGRMHELGVAHGSLDPAAVRFDAIGAPVLCGFADAVVAERVDTTGFAAACAADRLALGRVAATLLRRAGVAAERVELVVTDWADSAVFAAALDALFALAEPAPVRFDRRASTMSSGQLFSGAPTRLIEPAAPSEPSAAQGDSASLEQKGLPRDQLRERIRVAVRSVRTRVWVAAGSGITALVAAITLLPAGGR